MFPMVVALALGVGASLPSVAAADNDDRAGAFVLTPFEHDDWNNVNATIENNEQLTPNDPAASGCRDATHSPAFSGSWMGATVWYKLVGDGSTLTVDTIGSDFDTVLAAYRGDSVLMCSDDWAYSRSGASMVRIETAPGVIYHLQVGGWCDPATGFTCAEGSTRVTVWGQPSHVASAGAENLALGSPMSTDNIGATETPGELQNCGDAPFGKTVWYRVAAPAAGTLTVSAVDSAFDSVVAVYPATGGAALTCSDDGATSASARVESDVQAGTYLVQVGGYGRGVEADEGSFSITADFRPDYDRDDDGVNAPPHGGDCNDSNRAIRPGAAEVFNNSVDENCDGVAALDADGDGRVSHATGGDDCNDGNAAIRPGAAEVPGNRVDEDCSGADQAYDRVRGTPKVRYTFDRRSSQLTVIGLSVEDLEANTTVAMRCDGRGCPKRRTVTRKVTRTTPSLRIDVRFKKKLRRSAGITLSITHPSKIGTVRKLVVRNRKVEDRTSCMWPGETKARKCP